MFLRINKLPVQLPASPTVDPVAAINVQELLGGRFGEMSTLMNYTFQSFNMRGRDQIKPFYSLVSNIAAEEGGHIEIVSAAINACLTGNRTEGFDNTEDRPRADGWKPRRTVCSAATTSRPPRPRCRSTRAACPGPGSMSSHPATWFSTWYTTSF